MSEDETKSKRLSNNILKGRTPEDIKDDNNAKRGRKPIDWDELKLEWLGSGLSKSKFLEAKGISPTSGTTARKTKLWNEELKEAHGKITQAYLQSVTDKSIPEIADVMPEKVNSGAWKRILEWRAKQSENDYKVTDVIRLHCKVILQSNLKKVINESGEEELQSTLSPTELRGVASAMEKVQRMQRLALGLSTENIGVSAPSTNTESQEDSEVPTFEIQMSKGGKFKTVRPRQVN